MPRVSEQLAELNRDLEIARHYRKQNYLPDWVYWEKVYNDQVWGGNEKSRSARRASVNEKGFIPQLNELESIVLTILPEILFFDPAFEFTPTHPAWDWSAAVWELFAAHLYKIKEFDETLEEIALDGLILGSGVHKSGYSYEVADTSYQLGDATTGKTETSKDMTFSDWVSPKDLLLDYRVDKWGDVRWIAQEIRKPVEEVKANKMYSNTSDLVGTLSSTDQFTGMTPPSRKEFKNRKNDTVLLTEIHDLEQGKIITVADKHDKFLRRDDDYGIPLFDMLSFTPARPKRVFGKSIAQSIEEHMIAVSKYLYYMDEHTRRGGVSRWVFDKNKVDRDVIEKMKSPTDFAMIGVEDLDGGIPIQEIKASPMSMEWFSLFNMRQSMMRMLSGVTMQSRGRHEPGVETAFEAAKLQEAGDGRNRSRVKKLNRFIAKIMERQLRIVSDTWSREQILASLGIPAELSFKLLPFTNMAINVKFGSTAMQARNEELQKVMSLAQILGQAGIQVNPEGFVKIVSNAIGLDFRQLSLLLQQPPTQGQGGTGSQPGTGEPGGGGGGTDQQILGQLLSSSRGGS